MSHSSRPDELSTTLRRLRRDADLSGMEAARRAGYSQPKISRFETGRQVPTPAQVATLSRLYNADPQTQARLVAIAEDLHAGTTRARAVLSHGARHMQQRLGRIERASSLIRSFVPTMVTGLLQTPDYARAIASRDLTGDDLAAFVAARVDRQTILDTDRQIVAVLTEGALRWHVGSPQIMAVQMEHLIEATHRLNLCLGVIPWTVRVHSPALHCFSVYDSRAVVVGTETATAVITDPADVADYEKRHALYNGLVVVGKSARTVFARLASEYHDLT